LASSPGFPAGPPTLGLASPRRGGLCTPARKASRRPQDHPPFGHRPLANSPVITTSLGLRPALPNGRTECAPPRRPPFASSPGFPAGPPTLGLASPRRGGLRTPARKASRRPQDHPPFGHRPLAKSPLITTSLGLLPALPNGRTECVPPTKAPLTPSPGLPPRGLLAFAWPFRGGAGSARPQGTHRANPNVAPFCHRPIAHPR
jgi:hypothetical protein